jgi:hypothetical protein
VCCPHCGRCGSTIRQERASYALDVKDCTPRFWRVNSLPQAPHSSHHKTKCCLCGCCSSTTTVRQKHGAVHYGHGLRTMLWRGQEPTPRARAWWLAPTLFTHAFVGCICGYSLLQAPVLGLLTPALKLIRVLRTLASDCLPHTYRLSYPTSPPLARHRCCCPAWLRCCCRRCCHQLLRARPRVAQYHEQTPCMCQHSRQEHIRVPHGSGPQHMCTI